MWPPRGRRRANGGQHHCRRSACYAEATRPWAWRCGTAREQRRVTRFASRWRCCIAASLPTSTAECPAGKHQRALLALQHLAGSFAWLGFAIAVATRMAWPAACMRCVWPHQHSMLLCAGLSHLPRVALIRRWIRAGSLAAIRSNLLCKAAVAVARCVIKSPIFRSKPRPRTVSFTRPHASPLTSHDSRQFIQPSSASHRSTQVQRLRTPCVWSWHALSMS